MATSKKEDISLSQFLKNKRLEKNLTQMQAAKALGHSSAQYISNFERGLCEPSLETAIKLCKIYGIGKKELYELMIHVYKQDLKQKIFASTVNARG